jgi:hypothetical protein
MIAGNGLVHDEMVKLLNVRNGRPAGLMNREIALYY